MIDDIQSINKGIDFAIGNDMVRLCVYKNNEIFRCVEILNYDAQHFIISYDTNKVYIPKKMYIDVVNEDNIVQKVDIVSFLKKEIINILNINV